MKMVIVMHWNYHIFTKKHWYRHCSLLRVDPKTLKGPFLTLQVPFSDSEGPFLTIKTPLTLLKMAPGNGLFLIPTTKQKWGLAWPGSLFIWNLKKKGSDPGQGVMGCFQAKLSKLAVRFGPYLACLVDSCWHFKGPKTCLNVLQGLVPG